MHWESYSYRFAEEILNSKLNLKKEIENAISELNLSSDVNHHTQIVKIFSERGWSTEEAISEDISMRHDLYKHSITCHKHIHGQHVPSNQQRRYYNMIDNVSTCIRWNFTPLHEQHLPIPLSVGGHR